MSVCQNFHRVCASFKSNFVGIKRCWFFARLDVVYMALEAPSSMSNVHFSLQQK